jgi:hypothetical protein
MDRLLGKLTYANVISTFCLFLLIGGGTAFAATQLGKNSVGTQQIKKAAVTPAKLSASTKKTLTGPQGPTGSKGSSGPKGATGAKGDEGDKGERGERGEPGQPTTKLWAVVSAGQEVIRAKNASSIEAIAPGAVDVVFNQDVSQCNFQATIGTPEAATPSKGFISVATQVNNPDGVFVTTSSTADTAASEPFHLAVFC